MRTIGSVLPARAVGALLALAFTACGSGAGSPQGDGVDDTGQFIAFASSFQGYIEWKHAPAMPEAGAPADVVHAKGPWTVYWNQDPPHGATEFPIGTIIVKETDPGVVDPPQIFAMVKRGGNFNDTGARNWEWFELVRYADETVSITWHGFGPPMGTESYGGDRTVCNNCHSLASAKDFVWSTALRLTSL
jgi:hypothetical protein